MKRVRVERKAQQHREDRSPVLPLDPRDPEVIRAKQRSTRSSLRERL